MIGSIEETTEMMQMLARGIDKVLNGDAEGADRKVGFALLVFPPSGPEGERTNYVSNAERRDMVVALKEIVARFEGQPEIVGRA